MEQEQKKCVLVVEDETPLAEAIKMKLEDRGFYVVTARTVEQALSYLQDLKKVDVIWLDHYLLGKGDGLSFLQKVKSEGAEWRNIPVFLVTNTASNDKIESYMRLGVEKYYLKATIRIDQVIDDIDKSLKVEANN